MAHIISFTTNKQSTPLSEHIAWLHSMLEKKSRQLNMFELFLMANGHVKEFEQFERYIREADEETLKGDYALHGKEYYYRKWREEQRAIYENKKHEI